MPDPVRAMASMTTPTAKPVSSENTPQMAAPDHGDEDPAVAVGRRRDGYLEQQGADGDHAR